MNRDKRPTSLTKIWVTWLKSGKNKIYATLWGASRGQGSALDWTAKVFASKFGIAAKLLFDAQDLVVFGESLGSAWGAGFDLASGKAHHQVSDEGVLGLARSMRHHRSPAILFRKQMPKIVSQN